MEYKDYYKIMGLARDATQDEIKRSYRLLARKFHPDVSKEPDAEARFKEVGEANEVLKDPEKRAAYDKLGANWKAGQEFRPPPDWKNGFEFSGGGFTGGDAAQFSDFFESLYGRDFSAGRSHRQPFQTKGEDHHARVSVDLEDAYIGANRTITLQVPEVDAQGHVSMRERKLNVTIPRGIRAGQHIRLAGQGAAGLGQGKSGDLYLEIEFRPHPLYRVEQHDVYLDLPVAPWEAALGSALNVPTPGGVVEIKIPAGATAGNKLRLKGRGIPSSTPGDFYAVLKIALPSADDDATKEIYRNMAAQFKTFNPRSKLGV
jgi:curved DNA-binding protein